MVYSLKKFKSYMDHLWEIRRRRRGQGWMKEGMIRTERVAKNQSEELRPILRRSVAKRRTRRYNLLHCKACI